MTVDWDGSDVTIEKSSSAVIDRSRPAARLAIESPGRSAERIHRLQGYRVGTGDGPRSERSVLPDSGGLSVPPRISRALGIVRRIVAPVAASPRSLRSVLILRGARQGSKAVSTSARTRWRFYNLTSTYFVEGSHWRLPNWGTAGTATRARCRSCSGSCARRRGCPVAVEVFSGSIDDPKTVSP